MRLHTLNLPKLSIVALLLLTCLSHAWADQSLSPYVKYQPGKLQTSIVTLQDSTGRTIDLVSVVHIADAPYYKQLNQTFRSYDAVLYEMILPDEMAGRQLPSQMSSDSGVGNLQAMLASSLGLTTQLAGIDYSPRNFVHADLTTSGFQQGMQQRQESMLTYLQKAMSSSGNLSMDSFDITEEELSRLNFMSLMTGSATPQEQTTFKKLMASAVASSGGVMGAMSDTTILAGRNRAALQALETQLAKGSRKVALFYGAAHMPDLRRSLRAQGWKAVESRWLTAWTI